MVQHHFVNLFHKRPKSASMQWFTLCPLSFKGLVNYRQPLDEPVIQSTMKCNNKQHVDHVIAVVLASAHTHTHEVIKVV